MGRAKDLRSEAGGREESKERSERSTEVGKGKDEGSLAMPSRARREDRGGVR